MFSFFKKSKTTKAPTGKTVEVGKTYYFIVDENTPFCEGEKVYNTVLDIKDGYVKSKLGKANENTIWSPKITKINVFMNVYKYKYEGK